MQNDWYKGLNTEQCDAVAHSQGPMLILAGAGSGKTTVLVSRTGRLISEGIVASDALAVLTFTNKAARELKSRVAARLGPKGEDVWAGTFHSFGLQILRKYHKEVGLPKGFGIIDSSDAGALAKELLQDFDNAGKSSYDAEKILFTMSTWREEGRKEAKNEDEYEAAVEWLLPKYMQKLNMLGVVDFDSLILLPAELLENNDVVAPKIQGLFNQIMVDEFQDTNPAQMKLVRSLVAPHRNLTVVGDDDQSIYGWRGANVRNILDFPKLYTSCKVVRLEQNYRSAPAILNLANAIIAKNTERHGKILRATRNAGEHLPELFVYESEELEAENICNEIESFIKEGHLKSDFAILYRSNSQGTAFEAELRKRQIPYQLSGGTAFFDRKETRDVLAYLRTALKPNEIAYRRILATPPRGIGDKTVELVHNYAIEHGIPFAKVARDWKAAGVEERAGAAFDQLHAQLDSLVARLINSTRPAGAELLQFLTEIGYQKYLEKIAADAARATRRWRYLELFSQILDKFIAKGGRTQQSIKGFVDCMELRDFPDDEGKEREKIQLMTLHACKGLEFPIVFLVGVEEDILPHKRLGGDISEERRLFYVGVTRAEKRLFLSRAEKRRKHGKMATSAPSRFLLEIPKSLYTHHRGGRPMDEEKRKAMVAELFKKLDGLA